MSGIYKVNHMKKVGIANNPQSIVLIDKTWKTTRNFFIPGALLLETRDFLLQEDGSKIYLD